MKVEAGSLSRLAAEWYGSAPALTVDGETTSFATLNERASKVGAGLIDAGVRRGDRIGVLAFNSGEVVEAWLGLEKHGLVRAVLHTHIAREAHAWTLNHIEATAVIFDTRFSGAIDAIRPQLATVRLFVAIGPDAPDWAVTFDAVRNAGSVEEPYLDVSEDAPCFLQLTSGTTGTPKPWIKTHRSWRAVIAHNLDHLDTFGSDTPSVGSDDVNLHFHPIQWASGFQTLYPYLLRGGRTVVMDDEAFDPDALLDVIAAEGVTGTFMPGPFLTPTLDAVETREHFAHMLRRMVVFFGTPELLTRTTRLLGPIWAHGFGSSEQGATATRLLPGDIAAEPRRIESVGRSSSAFFEVAVVDPTSGRRLDPGEVGEIVVRSPMSIGEYWGLEEASTSARLEPDWFRPGDVGSMDADGFLYYADRAGDEIARNGVVIYPHYVEAHLLRHPAVANCGVVGIASEGTIDVVCAVELKDAYRGSDELAAELLATFAADDPPRPDRVVFVHELPTVLGGAKVQRGVLREQLTAEAGG